MTGAEFFKDYGSPIAWCVAALGWWVSSSQANNRERRKEARSEIDDINDVLTSFNEAVRTYYKFEVEPAERVGDLATWTDCGSEAITVPVDTSPSAYWSDCGVGGKPQGVVASPEKAEADKADAEAEAEKRKDAALQIKVLSKEIDLRLQRLRRRRWCYPSQQYFKDAAVDWDGIYDAVTGDFFETDKSFGSPEAAHTFVLRANYDSIQFIQRLHAAALAHFDFFGG